MKEKINFSDLVGKTMISVEQVGKDMIVFISNEGERWEMYHEQDCCECVTIEDICGDLSDLENAPLLRAVEASNSDCDPLYTNDNSCTWTFYHLATIKGHVTIRWYGTSNGYYSEKVELIKVLMPDDCEDDCIAN